MTAVIDRADVADMHPRGEFRAEVTAMIHSGASITELEALREGLHLMLDKFAADGDDGVQGAISAMSAASGLNSLATDVWAKLLDERGYEDY